MEASEALPEPRRPLVALLAEAIEHERACQEALLEAARVRADLEAQRQAEVEARQGARAHAAERFRSDELTGSDVRDAILRFQGGFTISELASELDADPKEIKKYLEPMLLSGIVKDTGTKMARKVIYEYVKVTPVVTPARERRPPPEVTTAPAGELRMATGEPVRVSAMDKLTRGQRSGSIKMSKHRNRDRAYERMQEARAQGADKQRKESAREANARAAMEVNMEALRKKADKNRGKKK